MAEQIDLTNKRFTICGLQGSGKTNLAKNILNSTESHIVYDPMGEYIGYRRYQPEDRQSAEELDGFCQDVVIPYQPDLFLLDEGSQYIRPKPNRLSPAMRDLVDLSRHWGISWGCIARRPAQLHTDIFELSHYLFVFGLHGRNDIKTLNDYHKGMGDAVHELDEYHFAVLEEGKRLTIHAPVDKIGE